EAVVRHAVVGHYLRVGKPSKNRLDVIAMNPPQPAVGQEELGKLDSKVHHIQDHQFHDANWNECYMQCIVFIAYCMSCTLLCAVSISILLMCACERSTRVTGMPAATSHFVMGLSDESSPVQEGVEVLRGHTDQAFEN